MAAGLQQRTFEELLHQGRYLYPTRVVGVIERFHSVPGPGVPRDLVASYASEVFRRLGRRAPYTTAQFERLLEGRVAEIDLWLPDALYEVGHGRVSVYPPGWHRRLSGERDPVEYVRVIADDLAAARGLGESEPRPPVPKQTLIDALIVLGGVDRPTAGGIVQSARLAGRLVVEPFQNPSASVWIAGADPARRRADTSAPAGPVDDRGAGPDGARRERRGTAGPRAP
ncbi:MAG: hypothetical protein ABEJ26_10125 [Halosimplex sp.]